MITAFFVPMKKFALILKILLVVVKTSLNLFVVPLLANGVMIFKAALFQKTKSVNVTIFAEKIPVRSIQTTNAITVEDSSRAFHLKNNAFVRI